MQGECVIAISPGASELARCITEELLPYYSLVRDYYEDSVHSTFLAQVAQVSETHSILKPQLNDSQRMDLGMDHYWDFLCDRFIRSRGFSLQLHSELVWVPKLKLLYLPRFCVHSSGPHPASRGYSIRGHIYIPPETAGMAAQGQGKVYDIRGDRQMLPLARYFPARTLDRMDMYVTALLHAIACLLLT